jgi:protein-tyrosine phosphatase
MFRAFVTSVLLSLLFVATYGGTNWYTAHRPVADVGTWYFAWELTLIPFVPLLIVPYMSIDLFFFMATFLSRDEREIRVFARRVGFSILVATAFFLLLPLKLAWPERPRVGGWFGEFVEKSCNAPLVMEYPHNLFPTLHIALCLILADVYARHTAGVIRGLSNTWFFLIGISTILTWQHHLVDVAGGLVLAGFAFYLFRESATRTAVVPNIRVGCCYAGAAAAVLALVPAVWPWGAFLLWPAAALGMVAGAYFQVGPGIFHKHDGRLPLSTRFVLAPVLIGHHLSLSYYRPRCRAWDELAPGLFIGRYLTRAEAAAAIEQGVTAVLDLTAEFSETARFRALEYLNLPILDLTAPTQDQLHAAVAFISEQAARGTVYLHCKIGYSRTAAVAGAYLLSRHQAATVDEAVARLRAVRPSIIIRPEAVEALRDFAQREDDAAGLDRGSFTASRAGPARWASR